MTKGVLTLRESVNEKIYTYCVVYIHGCADFEWFAKSLARELINYTEYGNYIQDFGRLSVYLIEQFAETQYHIYLNPVMDETVQLSTWYYYTLTKNEDVVTLDVYHQGKHVYNGKPNDFESFLEKGGHHV